MPDGESSERLRDRAMSSFQQRRQQAQDASERLADRASSTFQQRRQQAERAREAVDERRSQFAGALDVDAEMVEPIQLDDRGEEIGFVPDERGRGILAERFADARPFVEPEDALVEADPRDGTRPMTDPGRRDEIADRAALKFAGQDSFAEPGDFGVEVGPGGVTDAGLTDTGAQRRAGRQFEAETPLDDVDPMADVEQQGDAFGLTDRGQRRLTARQFEQESDAFGRGDLDPQTDVRDTNGGFGLAREPARAAAAENIDQQLGGVDVGPDDIELERTGDGFEATFEREVRR